MKLSFLTILAIIFLYSCSTNAKKTKSNPDELIYRSADTSAEALSAVISLSGNTVTKELSAQIKLSNSGSAALDVQEVVLSTAEGLRSVPLTAFEPFVLNQGKDTVLTLKFNPLNELKLYQVTGLQGNFKPVYITKISYKAPGNDSLKTLQLRSTAAKDEFISYSSKHTKPLTGYSFNTKTGFNEQEKKYLLTLSQFSPAPFVYLSEQEIAITGLNFRLKCFSRQDTIYAELFIVNHADFPVKIMQDAFDINADRKQLTGGEKKITLEKVSGAQQHPAMMEKGDRVVIHFKKYLKTTPAGKENLSISFRNTFMLSGPKPLFEHDIQLVPTQF
jgi:hypothetical protein